MNRRSWLRTAAGLLVAPAIVRAESIMRVRPVMDGRVWAAASEYTAGPAGPGSFLELLDSAGLCVERQIVDPTVGGSARFSVLRTCSSYTIRLVDTLGAELWIRDGGCAVTGDQLRVTWGSN